MKKNPGQGGRASFSSESTLTLRELAECLRVHLKTIYRMVSSNRIPAFRAGGSWRFARVAIEEWPEKMALSQIGALLTNSLESRLSEVSDVEKESQHCERCGKLGRERVIDQRP